MGLLSKAVEKNGGGVRSFIENYSNITESFNIIFIKADAEAVNGMVSHLGKVMKIGKGNSLVLIPPDLDRQLLAHRISNSLDAPVLYQSAADSGDEAFKAIVPFL